MQIKGPTALLRSRQVFTRFHLSLRQALVFISNSVSKSRATPAVSSIVSLKTLGSAQWLKVPCVVSGEMCPDEAP